MLSYALESNSCVRRFLNLVVADEENSLRDFLRTSGPSEEQWQWLFAERLGPYLYERLRICQCLPLLTDSVQRTMQREYYLAVTQHLLQSAEVDTLLTILRTRQVDPIVLKGFALGMTIYPTPETRVTSDVDLLIAPEQIEVARQALMQRDYKDIGLTPEERPDLHCLMEVWRELSDGQKIVIEVHWHLFKAPQYITLDMQSMYECAVQSSYKDVVYRVLQPVDQLIHACGHLLLNHQRDLKLLWLLDLVLLVKWYGHTWDWDEVVRRAHQFHLAGAVRYWLEMAETWYGPCLSEEARLALTQAKLTVEEEPFFDLMRMENISTGRLVWLRMQQFKSWHQRARFLRELLFPPWPYMKQRYGVRSRWYAPLYYVRRLLYGVRIGTKRW